MTDSEFEKIGENYPWASLPREQKQVKVNQARNYIRYRMSKRWIVDSGHPLLTSEEKMLCEWINDTEYALKQARMGFFMAFYDNCPKVGSTLKKKIKPKPKFDEFT